MAIVQSFIDLDNLYNQTSRKILLNDLTLVTENLEDLIYTKVNETIDITSSCECGNLKGGYLLNKTCSNCGTTVSKPFNNMDPILWVRKFSDDLKFLNPMFWSLLTNIISTQMDGLRWLSDTSYRPPKVNPILLSLAEIIGGRSYRNLINNIDKVIIYLKTNSTFKTDFKVIKLNLLLEYYNQHKDILYTDHLPLINKRLFISEESNTGRYDTMLLADVVNIALMAISTANDVDQSDKKLNNSMAKLISSNSSLFIGYMKEMIARKGGLARKNIYGTRAHFSFRGVITALPSRYDYDTLIVPWIVGVTAYRPHLMNKLLKLGYTHKKANDLLFKSCYIVSDLINGLLKELIVESKYKGLPVLGNRNPSLSQGSLFRGFIVEFKTDITDNTIGLSPLIATALNADFDGDALNYNILLDNKLADLCSVFDPHFNAPAVDVYKLSGNINLPKTNAAILSRYISTKEPEADTCEIFDLLEELDNDDINLDLTK